MKPIKKTCLKCFYYFERGSDRVCANHIEINGKDIYGTVNPDIKDCPGFRLSFDEFVELKKKEK